MATSFLNKAGLTSLWTKIKTTFALKSEIPDSTSDLTNDSGFIDSARFDITVTSSYDSATDTYTYTADKTYQQITTAITEGKIPYVAYSGELYKYLGTYDGMITFGWDGLSSLSDGQGAIISISLSYTGFYVDSTNTWEWYADSTVIASKTSQLTNDSGFITTARFDINLTSDWDEQTDTTTYTADKTYQQITAAINEGKIPYVILDEYTYYRYYGSNEGDHVFVGEIQLLQGGDLDDEIRASSIFLSSNGTWSLDTAGLVLMSQVQSDWNQNNSADRQYIQNRVCYTGDPVDTQIFSGTVASGETYFELGAPSDFDSLEDGKEITLVIDGVTYNETLTLDVSNGIYWCGNGSIWEYGEDTGESYIVQIEETGVYGDFAEAFDHDVAITISTGISEIHTLDDKYLNGALLKRGTGRYSVILNGEDTHLEASGYGAVAEGEYATASSSNAHAEGYYTTASGNTSHAEGSSTTASGTSSHAEGNATAASGSYSHAEGNYSVASGVSSHAEGYYNTATGHSSHAEGGHSNSAVLKSSFGIYLTGDANATTYTVDSVTVYLCSLVGFYIGSSRIVSETINSAGAIQTITLDKTLSTTAVSNKLYTIARSGTSASGENSHTEGFYSSAAAYAAHAEGFGTYANHRSQHVFGEWNKHDSSTAAVTARGNYVEIVGNGTYDAHSNARTLDWSGNEVLAGKLTVGAAPTANMDVATKQYVDTAVAGSTISPATTSTLGGVIVGTGMTVSSAGLVALNYPTDTEMEEMLTANGLTATIIENWEEASEGGVS